MFGLNQEKLGQLVDLINQEKLDAMLLFSSRADSRLSLWLANILCPSAFHYLLITKERSYFIEVSYRVEALSRITNLPVVPFADEDLIDQFLKDHLKNFKRIGLAGDIPYYHLKYCTAETVDLHTAVVSLLVDKNSEAIAGIKASVDCLSASLQMLRAEMRPGWSAKRIAQKLASYLLDLDATPAFNTSVAIGAELKTSTIAIPSEKSIWSENNPLLIDCGAKLGGYYTDITRMFFVEESSGLQAAYQNLCLAQRQTAEKIRAGTSLQQLYQTMKSELSLVNLDSRSLEAADLGHGIGYALHEDPMFFRKENANFLLQAGNIITIEPEIICEDLRIRVEDMFLINQHGSTCLTSKI